MKLKQKLRGFSLGDMPAAAIVVVVIAIVVASGALILDEFQNKTTSGTDAYNIVGKGLDAMTTFGDWLTIIVIVVIAALVIGLLVGYFMRRSAL